ncbi:MAG: glycosyltransferase family 2 protein [Eubacteriales bacterium]|nr:glycosyltransferase family 2 protein [Eubacteriales bacterium]
MLQKLSIVIPFYNEVDSLPELYERICQSANACVAAGQLADWEFWFVDDGSTDGSTQVAERFTVSDPRVGLVVFRKNRGKAAALQAGFTRASGDVIITMDADLQDDPTEIPRFLEQLEEGYDVVSGWKKQRNDPAEKRIPSRLFNAVTAKGSGVPLHDFNCGFKAYRSEVVRSFTLYGELHRYIPVLAARSGFRITEIVVQHHKREHGTSKYGFERYLRGLFDSMTTLFLLKYFDRPMYFFGRFGLISFLIGFVLCGILTVEWLMGQSIGNRPLLLLGVMLILLGMQFFGTGYLASMIVETTARKNYSEDHIKAVVKQAIAAEK